MSIRKILFLAISGIAIIILIITVLVLSNKKKPVESSVPQELKIWINEGVTEDYNTIIEGFKAYAPEFQSTNIVFEKKTTDPIRYRTLLLSMMADDMSPDIFMIGAGEDAILRTRIEPVPEELIDIRYFEKEYDDIFLPLITKTEEGDIPKRSLMGVPLGFETMGMFYNKSLIREIPKSWNEFDILHQNGILQNIFVSNLGLGPRYTPNASEIVGMFLMLDGVSSILDTIGQNTQSITKYTAYKGIKPSNSKEVDSDMYSPILTLDGKREELDTTKNTTLDMFIEGKIGIIFGFPSLIGELEKSDKRIGSMKSVAGVIFTTKIPSTDPTQGRKNLARYNYFAISRGTKNPDASAKFLQYLMTPDAQRRFIEKNPYMIAAQRSFWPAQKTSKISSILTRSSIDSFIPDIDEQLTVFEYGLKAEFSKFLSEHLDRNDIMDISNIINILSTEIACTISPYDPNVKNIEECDK